MSTDIFYNGGGSTPSGGGSGGTTSPVYLDYSSSGSEQNILNKSIRLSGDIGTIRITRVNGNYETTLYSNNQDISFAPPTLGEATDQHYSGSAEDLLTDYANLENLKNPYSTYKYISGYEIVGHINIDIDQNGGEWQEKIQHDIYETRYTEYTPSAVSEWDKAYEEALSIKQKDKAVAFSGNNNDIEDNKDQEDDYEDKKKKEDEKKRSNWIIDFLYLPSPQIPGFDFSTISYDPVSRSSIVSSNLSGSINDWMAGGSLYDSPKAGNIYFNVTGDLNTVRFLGLQDKNYNELLDRKFNSMAEVYRILNVNAGQSTDSGMSASRKLYYKKMADSIALEYEIDEYNQGQINKQNKFITEINDERNFFQELGDDIEDFGKSIGDGIVDFFKW